MLFAAFDNGITHFDLANNYGPPPGAAEARVGQIFCTMIFPRTATKLLVYQSQLAIVTQPCWRLGQPQISAFQPGSIAATFGFGICGHFLSSSSRPRNAARRNFGRAGQRGTSGKALYAGFPIIPARFSPKRFAFAKPTVSSNRLFINQFTACSIAASNKPFCRCRKTERGRDRVLPVAARTAHR